MRVCVKTSEMAVFDRYFSMVDVDEQSLRDRYIRVLGRLQGTMYFDQSDALDNEWADRDDKDAAALEMSLDGHFRGDWVHHLYPTDPGVYGAQGGRFWPQVPSDDVLNGLQAGTVSAIHKALGDSELASLGLSADDRDDLWAAERENSIPIDDGIRAVALSWTRAAPAGENFFAVEALRGPSVVELIIATPRLSVTPS
jgi:hypothetical protein